jgi:hypothetical protein
MFFLYFDDMVKLLLPLLFMLLSPAPPNAEERVMISRIKYIMQLKAAAGQEYWPGFNTVAGDVPLVYFTDSATYAANPAPRFIATFHPVLIYQAPGLNIYKTPQRINDVPFHMATGMDLLDTTVFNYCEPYMFCSSLEAVQATVPDVGSTEEWASMVLHEYFHGFQYRHAPMLDHYVKNLLHVGADRLDRIYEGNEWFKKMTDEENGFLLLAIYSSDTAVTQQYIHRFLAKRKEKRARFLEQQHYDIRPYEVFYEKLEGTARYVEFQLLNNFRSLPADTGLQRVDTAYTSHRDLRDFELEKHLWLFDSARSGNYVYATGFNMARLLDKLRRPYKEQLFNNGALALEDLLVVSR